jgi:hypothetical protein
VFTTVQAWLRDLADRLYTLLMLGVVLGLPLLFGMFWVMLWVWIEACIEGDVP